MKDLKATLLLLLFLTVVGVIWALAGDNPQSRQLTAAGSSPIAITVPVEDRDPQPVEAPLPVGTEPMRTYLILPNGKGEPIKFSHPINAGNEISNVPGKIHVWRVTKVRFLVFDTYVARSIWVEEISR